MQNINTRHTIAIAMTFLCLGLFAWFQTLAATIPLVASIGFVALYEYLDAVRYKKSEEVIEDLRKIAGAIDDVSQRVIKLEMRQQIIGE